MLIAAAACVAVLIAAFFFWYNSNVQPPDRPPDDQVEQPPPAGGATSDKPDDHKTAGVSDTTTPEETTVAVVPDEKKTSEPAAPAQRSIFDAGLEGKWELVDIVGEKMPKEKLVIELARSGDTMRVLFLPHKENWLLDVKPDRMTLTPPGKEGYVYFRHAASQQGNRWIVSAIDKGKNASSARTVFKGWVKISEDWHVFDGVITELDAKRNQTALSMRIEQSGKKAVITVGSVNKAPDLTFKLRKQ
jgi:hypothetical protein